MFQGDKLLASVNLLVSGNILLFASGTLLEFSDTSEYPDDHTFYAFSPDDNIPQSLLDVIQDVSNQRSRTIHDAIRRLTFDLARLSDPFAQDSQIQDEEDDADEDEEMADYDEDLDFAFGNAVSKPTHIDAGRLQQ